MAFNHVNSPDYSAVAPRWRAITLGGLAVLAIVALMLSLVRI
jgi:cytosine/uracil/thiamine/allantoin permease